MNYLIHLYLSEPTDESLLGNLMGDFVKGRLEGRYSPGLRRGIMLHRRIDSFSASCPAVRRSRQRLNPDFGHCRGIMVDVFYDHFMARNWASYHQTPLPEFAQRVYQLLEKQQPQLPAGLQQVAPRMIRRNWLVSYAEVEVIGRVLERISERLSRPNPMGGGLVELQKHYAELQADFEEFLTDAEAMVRSY